MKQFRQLLGAVVAAVLVIAGPALDAQAKTPSRETLDGEMTEFGAMVGKTIAPERLNELVRMFRAASLPGAAPGTAADLPVFAVLHDNGTPGAPRWEVSGIALEIVVPEMPRLRVENAHVALMPSGDGLSCRFEISGVPFGAESKFEASGNLMWKAGPQGGDRLEGQFALDDAPVDQLRAALPNRIDPSLKGVLDLHGHAVGVFGEVSTEDVPATPLRGEFEIATDWQVLGRTAPVTLMGGFAIDDRNVRVKDAKLAWLGLEAKVQGWFETASNGRFDLETRLENIDVQKVTTDWNVPPEWRPAGTLSGVISFAGEPGKGMLRFEASAPSVTIPGTAGYTVQLDQPKFRGTLLAINAEAQTSVMAKRVRVGPYDLGDMPFGLQWWRNQLQFNSQNTKLWGGDNDGGFFYKPEDYPAFTLTGHVLKAPAQQLIAGIALWLKLDADGAASAAYSVGQDAERNPLYTAHASLVTGRIGGIDLFARTMDALAAADPALKIPDIDSMLPHPRQGSGTRVDKFFFEIARNSDGYDLGGMLLRAEDFTFDADGRCGHDGSLRLDGTMALPMAVTEKLIASAPWLSKLRVEGAGLVVPVAIAGTTAAPTLSLAPDYGRLLANAKNGQPVTAPSVKQARHVGTADVGPIPGDPSRE